MEKNPFLCNNPLKIYSDEQEEDYIIKRRIVKTVCIKTCVLCNNYNGWNLEVYCVNKMSQSVEKRGKVY